MIFFFLKKSFFFPHNKWEEDLNSRRIIDFYTKNNISNLIFIFSLHL